MMPNSMEMWLAPALAMMRGMVNGLTRARPQLVELDEPGVLARSGRRRRIR